MSRLRAAESLLSALQHLPPPASAPPAALQAHPGEALQALPAHPRRLQGLQRYGSAFSFYFHPHLSSLICIFIYSHLFIFLSAALADISEMVVQLQGTMMKMENFQKLLELKKDLTGIDILAIPGRVGLQISSHFVIYLYRLSVLLLVICLCSTCRNLSGSAASASSQGRAFSRGCSSWYDSSATSRKQS